MDAHDRVARHRPAATPAPTASRQTNVVFLEMLQAAGITARNGDPAHYVRTRHDLGLGAFATVVLAYRHTGDGVWGRAALKNLGLRRAETLRDVVPVVAMARREIEMCRRVRDSPHVIAMHDPWFDRRAGTLTLPMEAGDCSLAEYAERRGYAYPPVVLLSVFVQCARALEAVHRCGVLHRDVKPDNFVVNYADAHAGCADVTVADASRPPFVRIADFGLACGFEEARKLVEPCVGTPAFMAPEVLAEGGPGDTLPAARDVWSLGAAFVHLATGVLPRRDSELSLPALAAGKYRQLRAPPPSSAGRGPSIALPTMSREGRPLPPYVQTLLAVAASMLAVDPRQRPTAARVVQQLEAIAAVPKPDLSLTAVPVHRLRVCRPDVKVRVYAVPQAVEGQELPLQLLTGDTFFVEGEVWGWSEESCGTSLCSLDSSIDRHRTGMPTPTSERFDSLQGSPLQRARNSMPPPPPDTDTWLRVVHPQLGYCCRFQQGQHVVHEMRGADVEEATRLCPPLRAESQHARHLLRASMSPPSSHSRRGPSTAPLYIDAALNLTSGPTCEGLAPCARREESPPMRQPAQQLMWPTLHGCRILEPPPPR